MSTSSTSKGLIYIDDSYNIQFINCTFKNNSNFISMIQCDSYSYCEISIINSKFINNVDATYSYRSMINGILLESYAYSTITIKNTCFELSVTLYY